MEIFHFKDLGDKSVISECSLGVNLVSDNFCYVISDTSPLYKIWKQSDHYLWWYCILKIWGTSVVSECNLGVNLPVVIDNFIYVASDTFERLYMTSCYVFLINFSHNMFR